MSYSTIPLQPNQNLAPAPTHGQYTTAIGSYTSNCLSNFSTALEYSTILSAGECKVYSSNTALIGGYNIKLNSPFSICISATERPFDGTSLAEQEDKTDSEERTDTNTDGTNPVKGDEWIDSSSGDRFIYDGTSWNSSSSICIASGSANDKRSVDPDDPLSGAILLRSDKGVLIEDPDSPGTLIDILKELKSLREQVRELWYAPGAPGFIEAQSSFSTLVGSQGDNCICHKCMQDKSGPGVQCTYVGNDCGKSN